MKGKGQGKYAQVNLLRKSLMEQLNPKEPLLILARRIPWDTLCAKYYGCYAGTGRPAKPIRLMLGLLLLKQLENLSDERLIEKWVQNPYYQSFCGVHEFQWKFPCDPSDLTYFRRRIGQEGCEQLFKVSVELHEDKAKEADVVIDSTVQEKAVTFPTDTKLHIKIISKCKIIARKESIALRRSFVHELPELLRTVRFCNGKKAAHKQRRAKKRLKTIAGILVRELSRKLTGTIICNYSEELALFKQVLFQDRKTKNKVYSLHEPQVACIAKGKLHKKYEFGSKVSIAMTKMTGIIVGVAHFLGNPYDGDTLDNTLNSIKSTTGQLPTTVFTDRGYRGRETVQGVKVSIPSSPSKTATAEEKDLVRKNFGRRSAIEPVIGHLKSDFRLARNYLKGAIGDVLNLILAATAFNLRKWMRALPLCLFLGLQGLFTEVFAERGGLADCVKTV